jgi:glycosyltransferase involved in cell wall biosynthesis
MKIFVAGTRGIPDIPGGIERHCQELYPRIVKCGHRVILARRKPYIAESRGLRRWNGVNLLDLPASRIKSLEAIFHTFFAVLAARILKIDILHVHGIGPSLIVPFARLLGLKVINTNHGPDYDRDKWGKIAKIALRLGEYLGGRFSNKTVVISKLINDIVRKRCKIEPIIIPNGVIVKKINASREKLEKIGVEQNKYILAVARLVPEKGLHDLIDAFKNIDIDLKLVIAGDADHKSGYSRDLKLSASGDDRIIMTGYITGPTLDVLYANASLFVLPSYHEGLPIVLLEALSFGAPVLVSDIPANLEIGLPEKNYFAKGDIESLASGLRRILKSDYNDDQRKIIIKQIQKKYDWDLIAKKTIDVYKAVINNRTVDN